MTETFGVLAGLGILIFLWSSGVAVLRYVDFVRGEK